MLERYGIVTRETVLAEGVPGGFASLYGELSNLEMLGTARRGYFVEGLGGAQFALPGAVERLRSLPRADGALPGARRDRPREPLRRRRCPGRSARAQAAGAAPDARRLRAAPRRRAAALRRARRQGHAAAARARRRGAGARRSARSPRPPARGRCPSSAIERVDGEPVIGSGLEEALIDAGFARQPRRARGLGL